jgi:hypothetical protein
MRTVFVFLALISVSAARAATCSPYDPSSAEVEAAQSLLAKDLQSLPSLESVCISSSPPFSFASLPNPAIDPPSYYVRYAFAWEPHERLEDISFRWSQKCGQRFGDTPRCSEPTVQARVFDGPWFQWDQDLRREDVLSFVGLTRGLLDEDEVEAVLRIEIWPFSEKDWELPGRQDYAVVVGRPGWSCEDFYPVTLSCSSRTGCSWVFQLKNTIRVCI